MIFNIPVAGSFGSWLARSLLVIGVTYNFRTQILKKVNYLGTSTRGIPTKLNFNFQASLGVLNPLAVPIKVSGSSDIGC